MGYFYTRRHIADFIVGERVTYPCTAGFYVTYFDTNRLWSWYWRSEIDCIIARHTGDTRCQGPWPQSLGLGCDIKLLLEHHRDHRRKSGTSNPLCLLWHALGDLHLSKASLNYIRCEIKGSKSKPVLCRYIGRVLNLLLTFVMVLYSSIHQDVTGIIATK
jgi:hypothetical protein